MQKKGMQIVTRFGMKKGEAFFFRSCAPNVAASGLMKGTVDTIPGIVHGAFRITSQSFLRRSMEVRFLIIKKTETIEKFFDDEQRWLREVDQPESFRNFQERTRRNEDSH